MNESQKFLKDMNLEIQAEQHHIKVESELLSQRKKDLKEKEKEYLKLSLIELEKK